MSENKSERLGQEEQSLYSRNRNQDDTKKRSKLHAEKRDLPRSWKAIEPKKETSETTMNVPKKEHLFHSSLFRKIFFGAIIFAGAALAFAAFVILGGTNTVSSDNIDIEILGNAFVDGGEPLPLQVAITNRNATRLELVDLSVVYQRSGASLSDVARQRIPIGEIQSGETVQVPVEVILFGQQGDSREITFEIDYRIPNSNSILYHSELYAVSLSSSPLTLTVDTPGQVASRQTFTLNIASTLNTSDISSNMLVSVEYPRNFSFQSADPEPTYGNNVWLLGDLTPGAERAIEITGSINASNGDERVFVVSVGEQDPSDQNEILTRYNSVAHTVLIEEPFIEATINAPEVVLSQDDFDVDIRWENNLSTQVTNAVIRAEISGNAFDPNSIDTQDGFFNSTTNTIIFDKDTMPQLATLDAGESGEVSFSIASLPLWSSGLIANPEISFEVSVSGQNQAEGTQSLVDSIAQHTVKIASDLNLVSETLHYSGPFENIGPLPPTPGQQTSYTITWNLTNTANRMSDVVVKTTLPSYVIWDSMTSPNGEVVSFNPITRTVTWNAGVVERGAGLGTLRKEVSFRVQFAPSTSQIGSTPNLTGPITFEGKDTFTQTNLTDALQAATIRLISDSNYVPANDKVVGSN